MEGLVCWGAAVLMVATPSIAAVVSKLLDNRKEIRLRELEVAAMEAQTRLLEAKTRAALPEFVDAKDPAALDAWRRARQEVGREL
jgi:hypothetical protein